MDQLRNIYSRNHPKYACTVGAEFIADNLFEIAYIAYTIDVQGI